MVLFAGGIASVDDIKILITVPVDITENSAPAPTAVPDTGLRCNIRKCSVPVIVIKGVRRSYTVVGQVKIEIAIVVHVSKGCRIGESLGSDTCPVGHIHETSILIEEETVCLDLVAPTLNNVQILVTVVVEVGTGGWRRKPPYLKPVQSPASLASSF
jgi:hypothetical protein